MKNILTIVFRVITVGFIFILLSLLIAVVFFSISPGEKIIRDFLSSQLQTALNQDVEIGHFETNLFSRIQLRNVSIYAKDSTEHVQLLKLDTATVHYRLLDLLRKKISIKDIYIRHFYVNVLRDSLGRFNFPVADTKTTEKKQEKADSQFQFSVDEVTVDQSTFQFQDKIELISVAFRQVNFDAHRQNENEYHFNLTSDSLKFYYQDVPVIGNIKTLKGWLNPDRWQLDSLMLTFPGFDLQADATLLLKDTPQTLECQILLMGNPATLAEKFKQWLPQNLYPIKGNTALHVSIDGDVNQPQVRAHFESSDLVLSSASIKQASLDVSWQKNNFSLNNIGLEIFDGRIYGQGHFIPDTSEKSNIQFRIKNIDLNQLLGQLYQERSPFNGEVNGMLVAKGKGMQPENWMVDANLLLTKLFYDQQPVPDITNQLLIRGGTASFHFSQSCSEIFAEATLSDSILTGIVQGEILDIEPLAKLFHVSELTGRLIFDGNLSGTTSSPKISANIFGSKIDYQHFPIDSLMARLTVENYNVNLNEAIVFGEKENIDSLNAPFHLHQLHGGFHYYGKAAGSLDELDAELNVNFFQPGYANVKFDSGKIHIEKQNDIIIPQLTLAKDSIQTKITGFVFIPSKNGTLNLAFNKVNGSTQNFPEEKETSGFQQPAGNISTEFELKDSTYYLFNVHGEKLKLKFIAPVIDPNFPIGGDLDFKFNFKGNLNNPLASLHFQISQPCYAGTKIDSVNADIYLTDNKLIAQRINLFYDDYHSWLKWMIPFKKQESGTFYIPREKDLHLEAHAQDIDLNLFNSLLSSDVKVGGYASYSIDLSGSLSDPQLSGELLLKKGQVETENNLPRFSELFAQINLSDTVLSIEKFSGKFNNENFQISGQLMAKEWQSAQIDIGLTTGDSGGLKITGTADPDSLNLLIQTFDIDAGLFAFTSDKIKNLSGQLNSNVSIFGETKNPHLDGNVYLNQFSFQVPDFNTNLKQGIIKLGFDKNKLRIDSVYAKINDGLLFGSGDIQHTLGKISDIDVSLDARNIKIKRPKELVLNLKTADLNYQKREGYFIIAGDLVLGESKILYNLKPQSFLSFANSVERQKPETPELLQKTRLNIRLRESENIWLDNNLARIRLHSELSLIGSPAQPNLAGRLSVEEGYVLYLDRKFKILKAVVDFVDPNQIKPMVEIEAQSTLKSYQTMVGKEYIITLNIEGILDQVTVNLTSDPPLEKPDILALLTFGTTREYSAKTTAEGEDVTTTQILLERAKALSSQRISGYAERKLGNMLGLKQISIEGNLFKFDKSWGPQLFASKKISDRVEVRYTTTVGHMNDQSIRLEYLLTNRFSVEGETDQQGQAGLDLKYKIKFK